MRATVTKQPPHDEGCLSDSSICDHRGLNLLQHAAEPENLQQGSILSAVLTDGDTSATIAGSLERFPEDSRPLIRSSLVFNLQAITGLKLLPGIRPDIPRVPCCEVLICNSTANNLVAEGRDRELGQVIRNSVHDGMMDFTKSLRQLVDRELISVKTA